MRLSEKLPRGCSKASQEHRQASRNLWASTRPRRSTWWNSWKPPFPRPFTAPPRVAAGAEAAPLWGGAPPRVAAGAEAPLGGYVTVGLFPGADGALGCSCAGLGWPMVTALALACAHTSWEDHRTRAQRCQRHWEAPETGLDAGPNTELCVDARARVMLAHAGAREARKARWLGKNSIDHCCYCYCYCSCCHSRCFRYCCSHHCCCCYCYCGCCHECCWHCCCY